MTLSESERQAVRWVQWALVAVLLYCVGVCIYAVVSGDIRLGGRFGGSHTILRGESPLQFWFVWSFWAAIAALVIYALLWLRAQLRRER